MLSLSLFVICFCIVNYCLHAFKNVSDIKITGKDISNCKVNSFYSYYKPAIRQAKLMLKVNEAKYSFRNDKDNNSNYVVSFAIKMKSLYEFYIRTKIKNYIIEKKLPFKLMKYRDSEFEVFKNNTIF